MEKKRLLAPLCILLLLFNTVAHSVDARVSEAEPDEAFPYQSLFDIVEEMMENIEHAKQGLRSTFINLLDLVRAPPYDAQQSYEQSVSTIAEAPRFYDNRLPQLAVDYAQDALEYFEDTMQTGYDNYTNSVEIDEPPEVGIEQDLERTKDVLGRVIRIVANLNMGGENTTEYKEALVDTGLYLEEAEVYLEEGLENEAEEQIQAAKSSIDETFDMLENGTKTGKTTLVETFLSNHEDRIISMNETLNSISSSLSEEDTEKVTEALENAETKLDEIRDSLSSGELDEALDDLEESMEYIEDTLDDMEDEETADMLETMIRLEAEVQVIDDSDNQNADDEDDSEDTKKKLKEVKKKLKELEDDNGKRKSKKKHKLTEEDEDDEVTEEDEGDEEPAIEEDEDDEVTEEDEGDEEPAIEEDEGDEVTEEDEGDEEPAIEEDEGDEDTEEDEDDDDTEEDEDD